MDTEKNRLLLAVAAFCIVVMLYQFIFNSAGSLGGYFLAVLFGALAAGATYGAMLALDK